MESTQLKKLLDTNSISRIVNRNIFSENPICFKEINKSWELREEIANYFDIHVKNIEIVGSGKLGISLKEESHGKPFNEKSDIDVLIVSNEMFDEAWKDLLKLEKKYYKLTTTQRAFLAECYDTIPRGFISPDKLPKETNFYNYWWRVFNDISYKNKYEHRKIRGRLFKNWSFAAKYYSIGLIHFKKGKKENED